ncbi:hypothetical protein CHS0354_041388 [Potamilus streckersoni]|uniref:Helicase domino n=1 Tax=Potamilus streckersoni TaxID=2493646 RepID=A0AAE0TA50_9BIVA|nr:hypothetical protein CHS0354_041388 [Potamilus streckersoni]
MQKGDPNDALQQRLSGSTTGAAEATSVPGQHYVLASQLQQASLAPGLQQSVSGINVARLARPSFSANQPSIGQVLQNYTAQQNASRPLVRTTQATTVSPSGATIHHMGTGMLRAGVTPFANLHQGILAMQSGHSSQKTMKSPPQTGTVSSRPVQDSKPAIARTLPSPGPSPRKKVKLEEKPPATPEIALSRRTILELKLKEMSNIKENYIEHLTELFFLQNGGNVMDYHAWKKRPTPQLVHFLKSGNLDSDDDDDSLFINMQEKKINDEVKVLTSSGSNVPLATPVAISTTLPPSIAALSQGQSFLPQSTAMTATAHSALTTKTTDSKSGDSSLSSCVKQALLSQSAIKKSPPSSPKIKTSVQSAGISSSVYDGMRGISTQEAIVERAKQEAQVMHRVAGLRKEGLWSSRRLPKVQEPPRNKAQWDYLLEEMQWLAADFLQERKWKKTAARKLAKMVQKHFQDLEQKELRAEKEEALKLKKIANQLAKCVKEFWTNIEKVVQYKQQSRLDEKRKKALDLHLNFIVDQTEKYSTWLTEGLANSTKGSSVGSKAASPSRSMEGDVEFKPEVEDSDDEETIDKEEEEAGDNDVATKEELEALQKESEIPIEDLLDSLPPEILEKPANIASDAESGDGENIEDQDPSKDEEFDAVEQDESDLEDTIAEQEKHEKNTDFPSELQELQAEGEMSFEDLIEKYAGAYDSSFEMPESPSESETDGYEEESEEEQENEDAQEYEEEEEDEEVDVEGNDDQDVGLEFLMHPEKEQPKKESEAVDETGPGKEITDIAAEAASLQPKGYTLQTTEVKTPVPFLLKHDLREYQHVGLDWLATMYEKKLNGILADEMGLGKTIQTISLLGHLACEKGIWGPHLIVVPTSVMLNWELELKKWCPAFKILTYYGSQKERKLKRQGWTKTNAFHVCITSYKLVIQDHQSFRRKKWKYLILDEAQNIKNFKSQRWQTLLNFHSQRRLLLTGTPLQNSLMELWSLMHFLMPHVFQSHKEFKEWFANPLTGMIEGSHEYNENLIRRLHKVLRPFLLRRLKDDVEKQMPKKFEHVVMCSLSKRQRYLYDDFMSQAATKETLASGHFMSVINILMQLRKVCNHPSMFDPRPIVSPFKCEGITYYTASCVLQALQYDPFQHIDIRCLFPALAEMERDLSAFVAHRVRKLQTHRKLIEEIDTQPETPARPKSGRLKSFPVLSVPPSIQSDRSSPVSVMRSSSPVPSLAHATAVQFSMHPETLNATPATRPTSALVQPMEMQSSLQTTAVTSSSAGFLYSVAQSQPQPIAAVFATPVTPLSSSSAVNAAQPPIQARVVPQCTAFSTVSAGITSQPITLQIQHTDQGTRLMIPSQLSHRQGFIQIVQTSSGQHLITTSSTGVVTTVAQVVSAASIVNVPTITTLAGSGQTTVTTSVVSQVKTTPSIQLPSIGACTVSQRPVMRVSPLAATTSVQSSSCAPAGTSQVVPIASASVVVSSAVTTMSARNTEVSTVSCLTGQRSSTLDMVAVAQSVAKKELAEMKAESELFIESLYMKRREERKEKLKFMAYINKRHCSMKPVYGRDLCQAVNIYKMENHETPSSHTNNFWKGVGMIHCHNVHSVKNRHHPDYFWTQTKVLSNLVHTPEQYLSELEDILARYVFAIPAVTVPPIIMHVSHPPPSYLIEEKRRDFILRQELSPRAACLHRISTQMSVQFPELRLIQYDCGKLQTLDILLRRLKSETHRVLIFTQMTRMLDILEAFLSFHGHRYLRLDGTTRVEQRQLLMERFNTDKRIFCFILSTRSGGIGVNLTGADTVIFYDSDWNPTMDAQAQDRCHRIGQTRDVHIYRLISEKTVEENILKKANQKRMLGDMAIEGGNFTTAFFKEQTIQELFKEPSGLETLVEEKEQEEQEKEKRKSEAQMADSAVMAQFEQALAKTEDETDAVAAENVKAEQKAELAEFDENIPWDEKEAEQKNYDEVSRVELELASLEKELTPIERYAVTYMENEMEPETCEELVLAEEDIETAKKEWELSRLQALKEEDERRAELEEDEMLFTYTRDDAYSQVYLSDEDQTQMPTWTPPTPPHDDNDIYIDQTVFFLYEPTVMPESQLPPVYVRKEHKKPKIESITTRKQKQRKEEAHRVPKSLFDRANPALVKLRRDAKFQKLKQGLIKPYRSMPPLPTKPMIDQAQDQPEWLIHEDWALLQAVQSLFDVPLNLMIVSPAHLPNWDMVADVVNGCSRVYRSPKQCRLRYENVIIPREEGRIMYDLNPRKQKKTKTKTNRPMKTSQLHSQDSSNGITILYTLRFDSVKAIAVKRPPTMRQTLVNPLLKNPKHASVLQENGISYDHPLNPMQVAEIRAQRIQRERKQNQQAAAEQQQQQQVAAAVVTANQRAQTPAGQVPAQPSQTQATTQVTTGLATPTSVATIVAQAVTSGTQAQQLAAIGSLSSTATVLTVSGAPLTQGAVRPRAPLTVQEITAISQSGQVTAQVSAGQTTTVRAQLQTVGSTGTTTLTAAHLAAAQRLTGATAAGTTVVTGQATVQQQLIQAGKSLTPQQLRLLNPAIFKQQQAAVIQQQQQQQQLRNMPKISLTQDQLRQQQQLGRLKTPVIQGQKVIAQQLVSMAQAQKPQLKTTVPQFTRQLTAEEIQKLKQQQPHLTQQKVTTQVQGQVAVSQQTGTTITHTPTVTASQGQFGATQIIAPVHQVGQSLATVTGTQAGTTLVKTVPAQMGSVTIPVSNVSINVSVPQKQGVAKATLHPQLRQMQLLQQKKVQQLPQKTTLGQTVGKPPLLNQVQIIQHQGGRSFTVQQLQQLMKQQQQAGGATIQQIIHTSQPTIIATVTQGQTTPQMVTTRVIGTTAAPSTSHIHTVTGSNPANVTHVSGANVVSITQTPVATLNVTSMSPIQSTVTASIVKPAMVTTVAGETVTAVQIHPITSVTASKLASIPQNVVVQPVHQVQTQIQSQVQASLPPVGQQVALTPTVHAVQTTTGALSQTPTATPTSAIMTVTVTPTPPPVHSLAVSHSSSPAQTVNLTPVTTLAQHLTPTTLSTQPVTVSAQTVQQTVAAVLQPVQPQASLEAQPQSQPQPQQIQMQAQMSQQQVSIQTQQQQQQSKSAPYAMRTRNQPKHQ